MPARIRCRMFWRLPVRLTTALVLLDAADGRIPGTALAGALRAALSSFADDETAACLFGGQDGRRESRLTVSDIVLDRDAVPLPAGATGTLRLSLVLYTDDAIPADAARETVRQLLSLTAAGAISLGAHKSRGAGRLMGDGGAGERVFDYAAPGTGAAYLAFLEDATYDTIVLPPPPQTDAVVLTAELTQRTAYAGDAPCVPGTVWSRAFRERSAAILRELGAEDRIPEMDALWGDVQHSSCIRFHDTPLEGAVPGQLVRMPLDPLTGSAGPVDRIPTWSGGRTVLTVTVRRCAGWMADVLRLVLRDLTEGYLAVGGQTSVGCGMFSGTVHDAPSHDLTARKEVLPHDA